MIRRASREFAGAYRIVRPTGRRLGRSLEVMPTFQQWKEAEWGNALVDLTREGRR